MTVVGRKKGALTVNVYRGNAKSLLAFDLPKTAPKKLAGWFEPFVFGSALVCLGAVAQAQVCRVADDSSHDMIEVVKSYAMATDSIGQAVRDSLRIPAVASASDIVLITRENICKSANSAYQGVASGARQTLSGRVYVVQVGSSYVVWDPSYRYDTSHPLDVFMAFDSRWNKKSTF